MQSAGDYISKWIEANCNQPTGGTGLLCLHQWQKDILQDLFMQENGLWKHRLALIMLPRGCGKSTLIAALMAFFIINTTEINAELYCAAGSRQQAKEVFEATQYMIRSNPELLAIIGEKNLRRDSIYNPANGAVFRREASDGEVNEGSKPYIAICDETWCYKNDSVPVNYRAGIDKRKNAMLIHITTPGAGEDGYLWELVQYAKKVRSGEIIDPSLYFYWNEPPANCDYKSPDIWKAYNPGYASGMISHDGMQAAANGQIHENTFRQKYLCQWVATKSAWLPHGTVASCRGSSTGPLVSPGEQIVIGVDGALQNDSTAVVGATKDGRIFVIDHQESGNPDWLGQTDFQRLKRSIIDAWNTYTVIDIVYDPRFIVDTMQTLQDEQGIYSTTFSQGIPMAKATKRLYDALLSKKVILDGNPALERHLNNATVKVDAQGMRIYKKSEGQHIDLAVAAVMAHDRARELDEMIPAGMWNMTLEDLYGDSAANT